MLVDQLLRNIHRRSPRAFAYDARAREVARSALARSHRRAVSSRPRFFHCLPFEHGENPADQARAVEPCRERGGEALHCVEAYRAVFRRLGRFAHRNAILGRPSTAEEEAFLREPASSS